MVVGVLGGLLGILMMIPLRRAFVVKQHGTLRYPEGTACAEVLIAGEKGGTTAKTVFTGFGIAFVYQFLMQGLRLWKETPAKAIAALPGAEPAITVDPTMLGVGYIIGTKISCIMLAGAVLSYLVLVPAIRFFGDGLTQILLPGQKLIRNMSAEEIRSAYILYIGAGAVAAGGIISLCRAVPLILSSIAVGLRDLGGSKGGQLATRRTDRDLSLRVVVFGSLALMVAIWAALPLGSPWSLVGLAGAVLVVLFGFLFVTVSSRLTGEIGSSSNPISGMTIATLILTCLIFLRAGVDRHRRPADRHDGGRRGVRSLVQRRHHVAGPEDRLPRRRHAPVSTMGHRHRRGHFRAGPGLHPLVVEPLQHDLFARRTFPRPPTPSTSAG